ncbi:MAG: hypothetical protein IKL48_06175 [Elusimicrobiaceae bacterium]|nr:hypothetical protein [Elusimicrobiaceae bacterium]
MNIRKIWSNRTGAIRKTGLLGAVVLGGWAALGVYNYATDPADSMPEKVKSLSQIIRSGENLPSEYSSIHINNQGANLAFAEEQYPFAKAELAQLDESEEAVSSLTIDAEQTEGTVFSGGEAGLGLNQGATEIGPNGKDADGASSVNGVGVGDAVSAAHQTVVNKLGEDRGSLPRASMPKVNAEGSSSSFAPYGNVPNSRAEQVNSAMLGPQSISTGFEKRKTNLPRLASLNENPSADSSAKQVRWQGGSNSRAGNSLRGIAVQSAKVAAASSKQANSHSQVFMSEDQRALGMQMLGDSLDTSEWAVGAEDFENKLNNTERNLNTAIDELDTTEEERKEHRSRLAKNMFFLMAGTVAAGLTINSLMKGDTTSKVMAFVLGAAMLALIGFYIADCWQYIDKYKEEQGWAIAGIVMGALMVAAIVISYFDFSKQSDKLASAATDKMGTKTNATDLNGKSGGKKFGQDMLNSLKQYASEKGIDAGFSSAEEVLTNNDKGKD